MHRNRVLFVVAIALGPSAAWPQGDPLGPEFRVNTYTTFGQYDPSVAADDSGNFVVVWSGVGDGLPTDFYGGIFGQRYASSGMPVGSEFRVNTYTTDNQGNPSVAVDSAGNFIVVWESGGQDGSSAGVFGQRFASSGMPLGPEFRVNTVTTSNQLSPKVATDPSGSFVVVWAASPLVGGGYDVFGQRYSSSGAPLGSEFSVNTAVRIAFVPSVAAAAGGDFIVVWSGYDAGNFDIFGQRYASSGAPLGPEFLVNTYTTNGQAFASVAANAAGDFVVVWLSYPQDGSDNGVFGQRYANSGIPLGPEFRVNSYTTDQQINASVALDASGNFVVAWQSYVQDGSGSGIFGQRYASSGAPSGPEFRVNSYTTGPQRFPSVAAEPLGKFVVTWNSEGQDGFGAGVFGQRYSPMFPVELMHFQVE